jgi:peptide/nickel transport system permease protein
MSRSLVLYIIRRLVAVCALSVVVSFLVFALLYIAPGNAVDILLGTTPRTPVLVQTLTKEYHLDQPFLTQYWLWLKGAIHFRFGNSIQTTLPVSDEIQRRWVTSAFLGVYAFLLTLALGIPLGIAAAYRKGTVLDRGIVAVALIGLSAPAFVAGVVLLYLFGVAVKWFPVFGAGAGFFDRLHHLTLPAVSLALISTASVLKHTRAATIGVLDQDYVTFARARGLQRRRILVRYVLRNALIPVVTVSGLIVGFLVVGTAFVESTFSLSGLGGLLVRSAQAKDIPMLQGLAILVAVIIILVNLLTDLLYLAVDPRIRFRRKTS